MIAKSSKTLLFLTFLGFFSHAFSGDDTLTEDAATTGDAAALTGDAAAGEERYNMTCTNCHGPAGKGIASFPKISGNEISYTTSKLETYRAGTKVGPNSALMIPMAKPLTDQEIANIAAYLKDAQK